jgi:RNA polymerase sigma-70 factor (sigma-E family)
VVNLMVGKQPAGGVLSDVGAAFENTVLEDIVPDFADSIAGLGPGGHNDIPNIAGVVGDRILAPGEPGAIPARPMTVTNTIAVSAFIPEARPTASAEAWAAVTEIYRTEYQSLVRLAFLFVHDQPTAEEVVQDSFEAMHHSWQRLRDSKKALAYMRQSVVNKSRSVLRHRTVVDKNAPKPAPDEPSAESGALTLLEREQVIAALRRLPERQREALVLRYYGDLSEADIASAMRISRGAVKSHTARGMSALRSILEQETS